MLNQIRVRVPKDADVDYDFPKRNMPQTKPQRQSHKDCNMQKCYMEKKTKTNDTNKNANKDSIMSKHKKRRIAIKTRNSPTQVLL